MRTVRPTEPDSEGADGVWHRHRAGHDVPGRSQVRAPRPGRQELHVRTHTTAAASSMHGRTYRRSNTKLSVRFEAAHHKNMKSAGTLYVCATLLAPVFCDALEHARARTCRCVYRLDENLRVKVADFGLSRDVYETDYYTCEGRRGRLPVKWMALESLEKGVYNSKTDVVSESTRRVLLAATLDSGDERSLVRAAVKTACKSASVVVHTVVKLA